MDEFFTQDEKKQLFSLYRKLLQHSSETLQKDDCKKLKRQLIASIQSNQIRRDIFNLNPVIKDMQTAIIIAEEIGMRRTSILGLMLHDSVYYGTCTLEEVKQNYGEDVAGIIKGLIRVHELYTKSPTIESENFRNLLLSFAEDMRVILIMIADRVNVMRQIKDCDNDEARRQVSAEAAYLYAPLAHKLGLYKIKSELEDLSLKYTEKEVYYHIKEKLNATKAARDRYIAAFIAPIQKKLEEAGLKFHIKGRTKSIHSIYQKMKKQKCPFEGVYDLFAIRIILNSPVEKEKLECWQVYSIITDMYQPNPKRLRDWLSVPKSNGYESLHITVMGPEGKWVEVQIRTERMDEIAERGLAAHWRYKGIKSENGLDEWLTSVREALENSDSSGLEAMDQFKLDLYEDEVFVFTPKGDLFKLGKGATVLDFAFHIHSDLGCRCIGAKVNGKNASLRQILHSGDQVEIMASNTQTPKQDWLNFVQTSKARTRIKQALKEMAARQHAFAKETLERKFKNRKIDYDEGVMMRLIKKLGYKVVTDFYQAIANEALDVNEILDKYIEQKKKESDIHEDVPYRSAEAYNMQQPHSDEAAAKEDVLIIDQNLKGLDFTLAKCCQPIYGDDVFGFVSIKDGIKIHRMSCTNAARLMEKYPYRIQKVKWSDSPSTSSFQVTLKIVAAHEASVVNEIFDTVNSFKASVRNFNVSDNDRTGTYDIQVKLSVPNNLELDKVISQIRVRKNIIKVTRL